MNYKVLKWPQRRLPPKDSDLMRNACYLADKLKKAPDDILFNWSPDSIDAMVEYYNEKNKASDSSILDDETLEEEL